MHIKEAAKNTVREAGDGTTTAVVLAESLLKNVNSEENSKFSIREIKDGITSGLKKINTYLDKHSTSVEGEMLKHVSTISCNNDKEIGKIISEAYNKVGKDGVVLMEESSTEETYADIVNGVKMECGLTSPHLITDKDKNTSVLEIPHVLIVSSPIPNVRKIQKITYVCKKNNTDRR